MKWIRFFILIMSCFSFHTPQSVMDGYEQIESDIQEINATLDEMEYRVYWQIYFKEKYRNEIK